MHKFLIIALILSLVLVGCTAPDSGRDTTNVPNLFQSAPSKDQSSQTDPTDPLEGENSGPVTSDPTEITSTVPDSTENSTEGTTPAESTESTTPTETQSPQQATETPTNPTAPHEETKPTTPTEAVPTQPLETEPEETQPATEPGETEPQIIRAPTSLSGRLLIMLHST